MDDELVEAVAMQLCRAGGYDLCVGFCHSKRCTEAIENYGHVARTIIPLVREAERADVVKWLRGQAEAGDKALLNAFKGSQLERDLAAGVVAINRAADAIERGEHTQESQP